MEVEVRKQFKDTEDGICCLVSNEDCFVPEMSLPVKDILSQFAFVDKVRLVDLAKQGYDVATEDENDFAAVDMDRLDLAEREELAEQAGEVINQASKPRTTRKEPVTNEPEEETPEE